MKLHNKGKKRRSRRGSMSRALSVWAGLRRLQDDIGLRLFGIGAPVVILVTSRIARTLLRLV
jgi:hypothetical protein